MSYNVHKEIIRVNKQRRERKEKEKKKGNKYTSVQKNRKKY